MTGVHKVKMERAVLYCFCVTCVTGAVIHEKSTNLIEQDLKILPGDELIIANKYKKRFEVLSSDPEIDFNIKKDSNKNKSGLEDSIVKINETDLYENGQDAKENNERSFVIINQKFKSQRFDPRPLPQKSLFDVTPQHFDAFSIKGKVIINEERPQPTHQNEIKNTVPNSYMYKMSTSYFNPVPVVAPAAAKGEYVELLKRPLVRPVAVTNDERTRISNPIKEFFRSHDEGLQKSHLFNDDSDVPRLANDNHEQNQYQFAGLPAQTFQRKTTETEDLMRKKLLIEYNIKEPHQSLEEGAKLDQHVRTRLTGEMLQDEHENRFNCYNDNCKAVLNKHNKILNNGIKLGLRCLCEESFLRDRSLRHNTDSLKDNTAAYENSTEFTDSEEAVVKETAKLITIGDEIGNAIAN